MTKRYNQHEFQMSGITTAADRDQFDVGSDTEHLTVPITVFMFKL